MVRNPRNDDQELQTSLEVPILNEGKVVGNGHDTNDQFTEYSKQTVHTPPACIDIANSGIFCAVG